MYKQSFFSAVSFFSFFFMLNAAMAQTPSVALKLNLPSFFHGGGVNAEATLGGHFSVLAEYQKINYFNTSTEGINLILVGETTRTDTRVRGSNTGMMFRYYPLTKAMGGMFFEGGAYVGRYNAKIVRTDESHNLAGLFTPINDSYSYTPGIDFKYETKTFEQNNVAAKGIKFGLGFSKTRKFINYEVSGGYSRNYSKLDSSAGKYAKDGTLYLRCAIGGAFSFRK
ncbi:MAG: hypothetical protein WCR52_14030 [Bacteroidota bacterium]